MESAFWLFAQSVPAAADGWLSVLTSLSSVGFAVWFSWYTTTKTIPEKDAEHRAQVASLVADLRAKDTEHKATMLAITTDFRASLREVTDHCEQELAQIAAAYTRETDRLAEEIRKSASFRPVRLTDNDGYGGHGGQAHPGRGEGVTA